MSDIKLLKEYVALVLEKSFQEEDIPSHFYVSGWWDSAKDTIGRMYLEGVVGISDSHDNMYEWFVMREFALKMPGRPFMELNSVSRVMYGNPHYLVSKNMQALKRLFNSADNTITKIGRHIANASKGTQLFMALGGNDLTHVEKAFDEKKPSINTLHDLAKFIYEHLEYGSYPYGFRGITKKISYQEFYAICEKALRDLGEVYRSEGEWLIKDKNLRIPPGSILYIKLPSIILREKREREERRQRYEQHKDKLGNPGYWLNPTLDQLFGAPGSHSRKEYDAALEEMREVESLKGKFKIVWIDGNKLENVATSKVARRRVK